jgi:hypothetical protein
LTGFNNLLHRFMPVLQAMGFSELKVTAAKLLDQRAAKRGHRLDGAGERQGKASVALRLPRPPYSTDASIPYLSWRQRRLHSLHRWRMIWDINKRLRSPGKGDALAALLAYGTACDAGWKDSPMSEGMLNIKEAARWMGLSVRSLRRNVDRSKRRGGPVDGLTIKYVQIGDRGPIRFKPEWLAQFVNDHAVNPLAKPLVYEAKKRKSGLAALL